MSAGPRVSAPLSTVHWQCTRKAHYWSKAEAKAAQAEARENLWRRDAALPLVPLVDTATSKGNLMMPP